MGSCLSASGGPSFDTGRWPAQIGLRGAPPNLPGWSAGKWGEWYPDVLGPNGKLSVAKSKPYWTSGWLAPHYRLMQWLAEMPERIPLVVSGDLHDIAEGYMRRSGRLDFSAKPVVTVLSGPPGTSTGSWPSEFRGVGALPPNYLDVEKNLKPLEENGFLIMDFTPEAVTLRYFRWNQKKDPVEAIDTLEPFRPTEFRRA